MKLSVDEALVRAVGLHKIGQLQEAERLYRAILEIHPRHSDANHNLGILGIGIGKFKEALPHFKIALDEDPRQEQFWISYISTLIEVGDFGEANNILEQGKKKGVESRFSEDVSGKIR